MTEIIKYIKAVFPKNWLSKYGKAFENEHLDDYEDAGVNINHPKNKNIELSLVILRKRVGISILKNSETDIELDLGGFDYNFELENKEELKQFLLNFYYKGEINNSGMNINLIVIRTDKPKELSKFYGLIGLKFEYHQHGKGTWHYSTKIEETVFEIYPLLKNQVVPDKSLRLGFTVANLDDLITTLKSSNIEIVREPKLSEWGYFAIIKDLDGRKIELKNK